MHSSSGFANLSSKTLQYLQDTIDTGRLVTSFDLNVWQGTGFVHLETNAPWSLDFECFLLDEGLPLDLHSPCRIPQRVGSVSVSSASQPEWLVTPGTKFGCVAQFVVNNGEFRIHIDHVHKIWPLGFLLPGTPANFVHLFSGGFGGWTQVQRWLGSHGIIPDPASSICVDADYNACMLSKATFGYQLVHQHESNVHFSNKVVVQCPIEDPFWLRALVSGKNLFATISFPCQPYSQGGRKNGVETKEGKAVLEAAAMMRMIRPVALALENVSGFRKHQHAQIIIRYFRWAGYNIHWEQIQELGALSAGQRDRWLAVLIRHDIMPQCNIGSFSLQCWDKPSWTDEIYRFPLGDEIVQQLKIHDSIKQIYAAKDLLPKGKHHRLVDAPEQVLKARIPKPSDPLATLVANYSSQHLLPLSHVRFAGIFAELCIDQDGDFAFFDPPRWASLLGCLGSLFLPSETQSAFHVLGNSIATPHAALALLCLFNITGYSDPPIAILSTILRMWNDRITSKNSMFVPFGDGWNWAILGPDDFLMLGPIRRDDFLQDDDESEPWKFMWPDGTTSRVHLPCESVVKDVLTLMGIPSFLQASWGILIFQSQEVLSKDMIMKASPQLVELIFLPSHRPLREHQLQHEFRSSQVITVMDSVEPTLPWSQIANEEVSERNDDTRNPVEDANDPPILVPLQIHTLKGESIPIELLDFRTVEEAIMMADPDFSNQSIITSQGICVERDSKIANLSCFDLCVKPSLKRKACSPSSVVLEIVSLGGQTTFLPTNDLVTIRQALQAAAYSDSLIACLKPEVNGKFVDIDSCIGDLKVPAIRLRAFPMRGGGKGSGKSKDDQILKVDPWAAFKSSSTSQASNAMGGSARWDQLELLKDHPWHLKNGDRIPQVKLLQMGPQVGGVAFATKHSIQQAVCFQPSKPTLLLLPGLKDGAKYDGEIFSKLLPPQQIIVQEPSGKQYKRIVVPLALNGEFEFKVTPGGKTASVAASNFSELVVELHSALASKQALELVAEQPLEFFRRHVSSLQVPIKELSIYSYRSIKSQEFLVHQVLMKVPAESRKTLLASSGLNEVFIRQFLQPDEFTDHTVLQRFWQVNLQEVRQAKQLGVTLGDKAFYGLALTPKGIAIRACNSCISQARSTIMQDDIRFTELNRATIVKFFFLAQGFSFDMSHSAIIEAIHQATKLPTIPLRSFKIAGLLTWVLGFEQEPQICQFIVEVGGCQYEILLTKQEKVKIDKKTIKSLKPRKQQSVVKPWAPEPIQTCKPPADRATEDRLQALEGKVAGLETQQSQLSSKVDKHYDDISDQLRRVLAAVTTRPREPTNETPPPKSHKTS